MKILIDNGHGVNTPGKCSPDGTVKEWHYTRRVAREVVKRLTAKGIAARLLVPEDVDIPLAERVRRANALRPEALVSIHLNAAGADGKWHNARGFSVFVARAAPQRACRLAQTFTSEAHKASLTGNRAIPAEQLWRANFAILRGTTCPAVLTENLFQDNRADVARLLSEEGFAQIVNLHVEAIMRWAGEEGLI